MSQNRKIAYVNYQDRATEFKPGDTVYPFWGRNESDSGRVVTVYPAIGMVDVQWPHGSERMPVEELQRFNNSDYVTPETESVPGGAGSVSVPGGPGKVASRVYKRFCRKQRLATR